MRNTPLRAAMLGLIVGVGAFVIAATPAGHPATVDAAGCVRIVGGVWNPAGNENYMPTLNAEYVKIKNVCSTSKLLTGWTVNDYGRKHIYHFPTGRRIGAGVTIKLHSGTGTNGTYNLYWQRSYGAVWNNSAPEKAYLRNSVGTIVSSYNLYP